MSMKKRMVAMVMAVMMVATMTGCGKSDDKLTVSVGTPAGQTVADSNKVPGEKEVKTLTQILDENEYTIWYDINAVDKNDFPNIMIFYNDGTYIYLGQSSEGNKKLGEYAQMSDEEIKTYVEEKSKEVNDMRAENALAEECKQKASELGYYCYGDYYATQNIEMLKLNVSTLISMSEGEICQYDGDVPADVYEELKQQYSGAVVDWVKDNWEQARTDLEQGTVSNLDEITNSYIAEAGAVCDGALEELKNSQPEVSYDRGHYYISVWTDATGNKVQKEQVSLRKPDGSGDPTLELIGVVGAQPVYESYYGGYFKENGGKMWITRIDSNIRFEYDAIGTEGVTIDRYADEIVNSKDDSAAATAY